MEEKYPRVKIKESNEIAKRLPIGIPILVISSAFIKWYVVLTQLDIDCIDSWNSFLEKILDDTCL